MPEVFRFFGFVFFFYSREHDPLHIHVEGKGGSAKYDYDDQSNRFVRNYAKGITSADMKRIEEVINDNVDIIVAAWNRHFGLDEQDSEDMLFW